MNFIQICTNFLHIFPKIPQPPTVDAYVLCVLGAGLTGWMCGWPCACLCAAVGGWGGGMHGSVWMCGCVGVRVVVYVGVDTCIYVCGVGWVRGL